MAFYNFARLADMEHEVSKTMQKYDDYYLILQVHHLAEPEVIEGAYRKLAKKYHPDVNKSADAGEMMKRINRAYEELRDPLKRKLYDSKCKAGQTAQSESRNAQAKYETSFSYAKAALDEYFLNIMNSCFSHSYELASGIDKQNITRGDFEDWQRAVTAVFQLREYRCRFLKAYKNKLLNGHLFGEVVEFDVNVVEYNAVMDTVEKDAFVKAVVCEGGQWRVFVGYEKLQPIISKFKALTDLLAAKSAVSELAETKCRTDALTGLLNQRGIKEHIESEIYRFDRYSHVFSLIMVEVGVKVDKQIAGQQVADLAVKTVGEILSANIRRLDAVGRWSEWTFLVLLPETAAGSAVRAANKFNGKLKNKRIPYNGKTIAVDVKISAVEYRSSLEDSLDRINGRLGL
jgi:diguanylate cyclase (GGDEF)-like protein